MAGFIKTNPGTWGPENSQNTCDNFVLNNRAFKVKGHMKRTCSPVNYDVGGINPPGSASTYLVPQISPWKFTMTIMKNKQLKWPTDDSLLAAGNVFPIGSNLYVLYMVAGR